MNQHYQSFNEPPRNNQPPAASMSWSKVLFLVHLAIFLFVAFAVLTYLYHSYRQGIYPTGYRYGNGFGRGYYQVQQAAPSAGPFLVVLFGWGLGLVMHFLGTFVLANRLFTGFSSFNQPATYYRPEQPPLNQQPESYHFNPAPRFPYAWPPPPPESGPVQVEANPDKDYRQEL